LPHLPKQIKAGVVPELAAPGQSKSDCYFIEDGSAFDIQRLVVNAAIRSLPEKCGADPNREIQVLTPMHKGALGTINLNNLIRTALNRAASEPDPWDLSPNHNFRPNDRVLQTKNNYNLGVFNGECGIVEEAASETMIVRFGDRRVTYIKNLLQISLPVTQSRSTVPRDRNIRSSSFPFTKARGSC
jgi:exodeoxyribonuclease V alpha subunit